MRTIRELAEVRTSNKLHPRRRIVVLQRDDGNFTFAEQYHYATEHEGKLVTEGWATLNPEGIYATLPLAEAEALAACRRFQHQTP